MFATTYDPGRLNGWNIREQLGPEHGGAARDHSARIGRGIAVRRSWSNQTVTDNRAYAPSDYDKFALTAPLNPSLPDGGGYRVTGLCMS